MEVATKIISGQALIEAAKQEDWNQLQVILVAHCIFRFTRRYGIKGSSQELKEMAQNLISEVMDKVLLEGARTWNTEEYSTFKNFLLSVIDSHLNNSLNKSKSKEEPTIQIPDHSKEPSPEDDMKAEELRNECFNFLSQIGATDEELLIFECMADGITKPKEIKDDLGMSETVYHNAIRRLDGRIIKLRQKISPND